MRTARENIPGIVYHHIWRFIDREWLVTDDEDRELYLRLLAHALSGSDWSCLAYAVMSNHIHLAMVAGRSPMAAWSRRINPAFASAINRRYGRIGPVFADRSKDFAILPENEAKLLAYIHNNPVRAGVVTLARESKWTSHRAYAGLVRPPRWLHVEDGLTRAGFADGARFDEWVCRNEGRSGESDIESIRRAVRSRGAINVATPTSGESVLVPLVARPFAHVRPDPKRVIEVVADVVGVSLQELGSRRRYPVVVNARRVAVHIGLAAGLSGSDIAAAVGISRQGVSKIAQRGLETTAREDFEIACARLRAEQVAHRPWRANGLG